MSRKLDLTQGKIFTALIKLATPILATSLIQMAYTLTDMIWLGRVGSAAVAGAGTAGFFIWLGFGVILISKVGTEVMVAQTTGKKDINSAANYARNGLQFNFLSALIYGVVLLLNRNRLIDFFHLHDPLVEGMAFQYLTVVTCGLVFYFINPVLSGIFNGSGDSRTPFLVNSLGLIVNIVLDPLLIFGIGPFPAMGVIGASIATITASGIVTITFIILIHSPHSPFPDFSFLVKPALLYVRKIVRLGLPIALQSSLFTIFAIFLARIIARWGPVPIAVQKVGAHIEAISWMTAGGFSTALSAFIGQNFGAQKWDRIWKGYFTGVATVSLVGITASALLIFCGRPIFSIFIPEEEAIRYGVVYLRILGMSQLFMVWEITTEGSFNGLGRTIPPSLVSIIFTGLRVPIALIITSPELLGLDGVWWSISMTSVIKGILLVAWFLILLYRHPCMAVPRLEYKALFSWNLRHLRDKRCIDGKV